VGIGMLILYADLFQKETQLNVIMIVGKIKERKNLLWHSEILRVILRLIEIISILSIIQKKF